LSLRQGRALCFKSRAHLPLHRHALIFIIVTYCSSLCHCTFIISPLYALKCVPISRGSIWKQKTVSLLHRTLCSPNLTFTDIAFIFLYPLHAGIIKAHLLCAHLHCCAGQAPIVIVVPVARPSSSLRRSSPHLHCCARRAPISIVAPVARPSSLLRRRGRTLSSLLRLRGRALSLLPRLCSRALSYRCAVKVAHSDSSRAVKVVRSVHCRAFEVTRSVYHHAVEATRSVYCRAVELIVAYPPSSLHPLRSYLHCRARRRASILIIMPSCSLSRLSCDHLLALSCAQLQCAIMGSTSSLHCAPLSPLHTLSIDLYEF